MKRKGLRMAKALLGGKKRKKKTKNEQTKKSKVVELTTRKT